MKIKAFEMLKKELALCDLYWVQDQSGVRVSTMYYWLNGKTKAPHLRTFVKVAKALGFEVSLERKQLKLKVAA